MSKRSLARFVPRDQEAEVLLGGSRAGCTYCGSFTHIIQSCPVYEYHHEFKPKTPEEDMIIARRKAKHFGDIPERYLLNPTPEQRRIVERLAADRAKALQEKIKNIEALFKKRNP